MNWMGPFCTVMPREWVEVGNRDGVFLAYPSGTNPLLLQISSPAFPNGGFLPMPYRSEGCNCNPPLQIVGLPPVARSLLVILEQQGTPLSSRTHWVCWDLPVHSLIETREQNGTNGRNDFLMEGYTGPFQQKEITSYRFLVHALRYQMHLPTGASRYQVEKLLGASRVAYGELSFFV